MPKSSKKTSRTYSLTLVIILIIIAFFVGGFIFSLKKSMMLKSQNNKGQTERYLSFQRAESGNLVAEEDNTYTLTLDGISEETILFSKRPERIAAIVSTNTFMTTVWNAGEDNFQINPPNAVISVIDGSGNEASAVIQLQNPSYENGSLTYTVLPITPLEEFPTEFTLPTLYIDDSEVNLNNTNSESEVEVQNNLPEGSIDANIYKDGKLLATKTS